VRLDWKGALGLGVSGVLIWWVLRDVSVGEVAAHVSGAHWGWFAASIAVGTAGYAVRAMRWKVLLHPLHPRTSFAGRFAAVCVGFMVNNLVPARVGEFARAFALSRVEPVDAPGAFGTLVVERFLDAFALLALLFVAVLLPSFPDAVGLLDGRAGVVVRTAVWGFGALLGGMALLIVAPGPMQRLGEAVGARLPERWGGPLVGALRSFLSAMGVLREPRLALSALVWTFVFWIWHTGSFWLGFRAFGVDAGFGAAMFTNAMVAFAVALPAAPGFFGTFQLGALIALNEVYGIAETPTLAFAFGYHIGGFLPITLLGLWYAARLGLSMSELSRSSAAPGQGERVAGAAGAPGPGSVPAHEAGDGSHAPDPAPGAAES